MQFIRKFSFTIDSNFRITIFEIMLITKFRKQKYFLIIKNIEQMKIELNDTITQEKVKI